MNGYSITMAIAPISSAFSACTGPDGASCQIGRPGALWLVRLVTVFVATVVPAVSSDVVMVTSDDPLSAELLGDLVRGDDQDCGDDAFDQARGCGHAPVAAGDAAEVDEGVQDLCGV